MDKARTLRRRRVPPLTPANDNVQRIQDKMGSWIAAVMLITTFIVVIVRID